MYLPPFDFAEIAAGGCISSMEKIYFRIKQNNLRQSREKPDCCEVYSKTYLGNFS